MKHTKELKIGIFVVVILVGSFFVINYLRGKDVFNREIELKGHFDNVEGLVPSAVVQYRGFKAGQVSKVSYCPETDNFEVICAIDRKFRIPADSKMTIFSTSIMGGKGILLETGESADIAKDGMNFRLQCRLTSLSRLPRTSVRLWTPWTALWPNLTKLWAL